MRSRMAALALLVFSLLSLFGLLRAESVTLNYANFQQAIDENEVVFVFFHYQSSGPPDKYRLWPTFVQTSENFDDSPIGILFGTVFCYDAADICVKYGVKTFPTLTLILNGEYQHNYDLGVNSSGQRKPLTVEALTDFVQEKAAMALQYYDDDDELQRQLHNKKHHVIGGFKQFSGAAFDNFIKVADELYEQCIFHRGHPFPGQPPMRVQFLGATAGACETYPGRLKDLGKLKAWLAERCDRPIEEAENEDDDESSEEDDEEEEGKDKEETATEKTDEKDAEIARLKEELEKANAKVEEEKKKREETERRRKIEKKADAVIEIYEDVKELKKRLDPTKHHVIGAFNDTDGQSYWNFRRAAVSLHDKCVFHQGAPAADQPSRSIKFVVQHSRAWESYRKKFSNYTQLKAWLKERCEMELDPLHSEEEAENTLIGGEEVEGSGV